jgi:hypothetical protein
MADLLGLSARFIDTGSDDGPGSSNRLTTELSEVADGIAVIEAFSHVVAFRTADGLTLFDASLEAFAAEILKSLRTWSDAPVHSLAYTHGHVDHVGGAHTFCEEARDRGRPKPRIVGHENLPVRFARYRQTNGYNAVINARQFPNAGRLAGLGGMSPRRADPSVPRSGCGPSSSSAIDWCFAWATSSSSCATRRARPTTTCGPGCQHTEPSAPATS